ncbi:2Fe-2S iron-sulfur cluster-binding protein [Noviherbaspirillum sp. Root189]|uniref:2Fe-2S iron-sulfur cluster-binding protein n=1 Tax=Noviherbaspirillum sp. Root189 TaxID=1736487 RepID=UPI00070AF228|nr:2Fe-2S iron-sulfur cluster-binding protein [Noviherbaspirillum sp. Root189]KRB83853.1 ferredoxin [Noviherbaspirillum sp. Root189]
MNIHVTDYEGKEHTIDLVEGWPLMEAIKAASLPIKAECGGCCLCATCHVYVDPVWAARMPEMNAEEQAQLDEAPEINARSRLACQIRLTAQMDGLRVALAPVY